jgi:hypothetical protein
LAFLQNGPFSLRKWHAVEIARQLLAWQLSLAMNTFTKIVQKVSFFAFMAFLGTGIINTFILKQLCLYKFIRLVHFGIRGPFFTEQILIT